jgi:DNA-binding beta-propeller fold protein YncE
MTQVLGVSAPLGLALSASGPLLCVANKGSNTIAVFTVPFRNNAPIFNKTLPYLTGPLGIAINKAGTRLYVADNGGGVTTGASVSIYVINSDGTVNTTGAQLLAGTNTGVCNPPALALDPSESYLYVSNRESSGGSITVYYLAPSGSLPPTVPNTSIPNAPPPFSPRPTCRMMRPTSSVRPSGYFLPLIHFGSAAMWWNSG